MTIDEAILEELQKKEDQAMTEDRALNILQNYLLPQVHGMYYEALKVAIQKMQTDPIEVEAANLQNAYNNGFEACRQSVLKIIYDYKEKHSENRKDFPINYGLLLNFIREIRELPSITPAQRTGKWIDTDNYYQRWKCSECGCHTRDAEPNYCPNCGAKMEEGEEHENS